MVKKVKKRAVVILSPEENRRVVQFVELLVTIARRIDAKRGVAKRAKANRATNEKTNTRNTEIQYLNTNKRKSLGRKGSRLQKQKIDRARKFYEPCLFFQTIYPKTKNSTNLRSFNILISRDFHDRHHCFNFEQQHVSHYGA
jgi:hypothetical protein